MKTKMIALFAVLVLSVALAGTAYAAWTTQITFSGSVSTGKVAVEVTAISESSPQITATWSSNSFNVNVEKIYPNWSGTVQITVKNTGSLPVTIGLPTTQVDSDPSHLDHYLHITTNPSTLPTTPIAPGDSVTVTVTLSVDNNNDVPQNASASYSGQVTFTGP